MDKDVIYVYTHTVEYYSAIKEWNNAIYSNMNEPAAAAAKSLQSCPTLCDPIDCRSPGPAVLGILQARTLEWVAISSSSAWKWKVKVKARSRVRLLATPWTAARQAPPSMGFSRQEYWSGVPLPSPCSSLEKCKSKLQCSITSHQSEWPHKKKKSTDTKCWRGCGEKGTLLRYWCEGKLVQHL